MKKQEEAVKKQEEAILFLLDCQINKSDISKRLDVSLEYIENIIFKN